MEVNLVSSSGLPEGAVLAIKTGTARSQGLASTSSPFAFPPGAPEQVVHVEVLQTLGTGFVLPKAKQEIYKQYQVDLTGGTRPGMSCEMELRPASLDRPGTAGTVGTTQSMEFGEDGAKAMRSYVEKWQVMPELRDALLLCAQEKPKDPFAFMAKHFRSLRCVSIDQPAQQAVSPSAEHAKKTPIQMIDEGPPQKCATPANYHGFNNRSQSANFEADAEHIQAAAGAASPKAGEVQKIEDEPIQKSAVVEQQPQQTEIRLEVESRTDGAISSPKAIASPKASESAEAIAAGEPPIASPKASESAEAIAAEEPPIASPKASESAEAIAAGEPPIASPKATESAEAIAAGEPPARVLRVTVVQAKGLRDADVWLPGDSSDPYCCCLLHKAGKKEPVEIFRTKVIQNNTSPLWQHPEQVIPDWEAGDKVEFTIWDEDSGKKDDFLGRVTVDTDCIMQGKFEDNLKLLEAGKKIEAYLTVKIEYS